MKWILIIPLVLFTFKSSGQCRISGKVLSAEDSLGLPGVKVKEANSTHEAWTDIDGKFTITVKNLPTILTFSFIGFETKEIAVNSEGEVTVVMKPFVLVHYFDSQLIGFYFNSGFLTNPLGGKFKLSSPYILDQAILKSSFSYQTNPNTSNFYELDLEFRHSIRYTNFSYNIHYNRQFISSQDYNFQINTLDTEQPVYIFYLTLGYTWMNYNELDGTDKTLRGLVVGLNKYLYQPLYLSIDAKIKIYKGLITYHGELSRRFRRFDTFLRYQKIDKYQDLSLGVGIDFHYLTKDR